MGLIAISRERQLRSLSRFAVSSFPPIPPYPLSHFPFSRFPLFDISRFPIPDSRFPIPALRLAGLAHRSRHATCLTSTVPVHAELPVGVEAATRPSRGLAAGQGKITSTD